MVKPASNGQKAPPPSSRAWLPFVVVALAAVACGTLYAHFVDQNRSSDSASRPPASPPVSEEGLLVKQKTGFTKLSELRAFACGTVLKPICTADGGGHVCAASLAVVVDNAADHRRSDRRVNHAIEIARVNDNFCDCPDGSDEVTSSACSRVLAVRGDEAVHHFACVKDPLTLVPMSRVGDGVADCCDGSDEWFASRDFDSHNKCRDVFEKRVRKLESEVNVVTSGSRRREQFHVGEAKRVRAQLGPEMDRQRAEIQKMIEQYNRAVGQLNEMPDTEPQKPQFFHQLQQFEARLRHLLSDYEAKNRMQASWAFGAGGELLSLLGKCFNKTVHEKVFRGGSAEPDQFNVSFTVCPFSVIFQRREEPPKLAATADSPSDPQDVDDGGENAANKAAPTDDAAARPTLLGRWVDLVVANDHNVTITALDTFGLLLRNAEIETERYAAKAPAAANQTTMPARLSTTPVHLYANGEECWQGPPRSVKLIFVCGEDDEIQRIFENGKCTYEVAFATPAVCTDSMVRSAEARLSEARRLLAAAAASAAS